MNPLIVDVCLAVVSLLLVYGGYRQGFIRAAGSLLGLVISIALGIWGVTWLEQMTGFELTRNPVIFVGTFLVLSVLISQLLRLIVSALDLVRKLLSIIPFVGLINSLLGTVLGVVQAAVFIGLVAYVSSTYFPAGTVRQTFLQAQLVHVAVGIEKTAGLLR
ncbi:MAG: hypothetical protein QG626_696 [Patescibacteria group bacterium]|nr:hypothetical protein [Patescibacteria group bacterium]